GKNSAGELGNAPATSGTPTVVTIAGPTIYSLALGDRHLCFNELSTGGGVDVRCFGASDHGQVGVSDGANHPTGVTVSGLITKVRLSAGGDPPCAGVVTDPGSPSSALPCWGSNAHGQLGAGSTLASSPTPLSVCGGNCNGMSDFSVGRDHVCAVFADGVKC